METLDRTQPGPQSQPRAQSAQAALDGARFEPQAAVQVAYLLSQYPAISHTFFLHEVLGLRARGLDIRTASINRPDRALPDLPPTEAAEAATTEYIKASGAAGKLFAACIANPGALLRGFAALLRIPRLTIKQRLFWLLYLAEAMLVGAWMKQRGLRHLHVHFGGPVASVGLLTAAAWNIPWSLTIHGPEELLNVDAYHLREKIRSAKFVFPISDFCRSQLCQMTAPETWSKFHVARLGVDPVVLAPQLLDDDSEPDEPFADHRTLHIVCLGRLVAAKGQRILLQAMASLRERGLDPHLTLIGGGAEFASLQAFVTEHELDDAVSFTGPLSHGAALNYVRRADIFVLASFAEGIPVALMEAMALEVPCVSTTIAGIPELIANNVDGLLVPPANIEALADALESLLLDPTLRRKLGAAGRQRVIRDYNLPLNQERLASLLLQQLAAAGARTMTTATLAPTAAAGTKTVAFDVSLIIVSFNTREVLRECLTNVLEETKPFRAEILVVENASTDGSAEMVEQDFPQVTLLRSPVNLGFGRANNLALERASGRYIVLLNSDAFFAPGALALAMKHMDDEPGCGLGGCRLVGRDGSSQPSSRCFHSVLGDAVVLSGLAAKYPRSKFFGSFDRTWADETHPATVDWVPGAFTILRPEMLAKVGAFDPKFFLYYEEVDLCLRLKRAGIPVWYWPDIVVTHIGGESSRQLKSLAFSQRAAQVVLWRMRSTLLYYRKHHGSRVHLAKWMEQGLYLITVLRNRFSKDPVRRERESHHRALVALMNQAWKDTAGGADVAAAALVSGGSRGLKTVLVGPLAAVLRATSGARESLRRITAHAALAAEIKPALPASVVVLGRAHVFGSGNVAFGEDVLLYADLHLETQGAATISIGSGAVLSRGVHVVAMAGITIGEGSMIGEYSSLRDANHQRTPGVPMRDAGHAARPITLGREVWVGRGAALLAGVTIGDGATIGAGAVVTRDVAAGEVVGGVPARPLRRAAV